MAVENLLRGVIVVGVLIVGGITASAILDRDEPPQATAAADRPVLPRPELSNWPEPFDPEPGAEEEAALTVDVSAAGSGQIEVELPGGFGFKLPTDKTSFDGSDFDIDGVGLYPAATARDMNVRVLKAPASDGTRALVDMVFTTPDSLDKVLAWYENEFADANIKATRKADQIAGTTRDGDRFTLTLNREAETTRGTLRLRAGKFRPDRPGR
jgi:hypothetical protein